MNELTLWPATLISRAALSRGLRNTIQKRIEQCTIKGAANISATSAKQEWYFPPHLNLCHGDTLHILDRRRHCPSPVICSSTTYKSHQAVRTVRYAVAIRTMNIHIGAVYGRPRLPHFFRPTPSPLIFPTRGLAGPLPLKTYGQPCGPSWLPTLKLFVHLRQAHHRRRTVEHPLPPWTDNSAART